MTSRRATIVVVGLLAMGVLVWLARPRPDDVGSPEGAPESAAAAPVDGVAPAALAASGREARSAPATGPRVPEHSTAPEVPPAAPAAPGTVAFVGGRPDGPVEIAVRSAEAVAARLSYGDRPWRFLTGPRIGPAADEEVARVTVRPDGRYDGAAFDEPGVELASLDPGWIVVRSKGAGGGGITLVPAFTLLVAVVDDDDGAALPRFDARITARGVGEGLSARDGGFASQWPRDGADALDVTVTIDALGYVPAQREVRIVADRPVERIEVRMVRATAVGTVAIEVVGAPAELLEQAFDVEIRSSVGAGQDVARRPVPTAVGGVFRFELEEGTWRIRLRPRDASISVVAYEGSVVVVAQRTTDVTWRVPPCGHVAIRYQGAPEPTYWMWTPAHGGTASLFDPRTSSQHRFVPVGRYAVVPWVGANGAGVTAAVTEGETTVVELK
ncbi:MAG: hypothetical protein JNM10_15515 [Planctomycetia bacterium]|nr:hypothetical protein [Planctomycetia bacterium]